MVAISAIGPVAFTVVKSLPADIFIIANSVAIIGPAVALESLDRAANRTPPCRTCNVSHSSIGTMTTAIDMYPGLIPSSFGLGMILIHTPDLLAMHHSY